MSEAVSRPLFTNRSLARLIGPLLIEQALAVTIGMADTVMVSSLGEAAVSSISLVDSINILLIQIFSALAAGGAVVASQYVGSRDRANACEAACQLCRVAFLAAVAIAVPCILFNRPIIPLVFGQLDEDVYNGALTYFLLSALSYPFLALYNSGAALFRSMGNSMISMLASLAMNIVNVCGNALLIYGLRWGVAGAGIATLFSRAMGAVLLMRLLRSRENVIFIEKLWQPRFHRGLIRRILKIGVPNGMENGSFQVGKLLVMNLIASLGTASIAANAVSNTIAGFAVLPGSGIAIGMVTVVGQCMGARRPDEAVLCVKKLMLSCHAMMLFTCSALLIFVRPLVGFFNLSPEARDMAVSILRLYGVSSFLIWPESFTLPGALRGAGDARFTMIVAMLSMWIFRIGFSYLIALTFHMGVLGVWIAMLIDWVARVICFITRWTRGKWRALRVI